MPETTDNRTRGILWMLATMFCFILLDAIMKHLLESFSLVQVTWARFFFATIAAILLCGRRLPTLAVSRSPALQALRSVLLMSTTGLFNAGIRVTPLATGTTIMFLSPLLVTVLSITLLGEKVGARRWFGVAAGFLGALIVVRPWQEGFAFLTSGFISVSRSCRLISRPARRKNNAIAASFTQSATQPATLQLGIVNRVVQKTFKIESITNASKPRVVSTALVQINDYGEYVINAWEIATID